VDIKTILKTSVAAGALFAFAAPVSDAEAGNITNANSKAKVSIGARVHRSILSVDDGVHEEIFHSDGTTGDSEMWLSGSGALTESVTVSASLRWDIAKNEAACGFGSTTGEGTCADSGNADKYETIAFKHKSMGTLTLGDVEPGADGTMDGRYVNAMFNDGASAAKSTHVTSGTAGTFNSTIGDYHAKIDPGSAANKVRWDSPSFSGLTIGADWRQDGGGSIGMKYAGKMGGMDVKGGLGYDNENNASLLGDHVAVKHASGFNLAYNYGKKRTMDASDGGANASGAADDPSWWRLIGGYQATMNSFGETDLHIEYAESDTNGGDGREAEVMRVGITQNLDAIGAKMGLDYARIEFSDTAATDFNDIDAVVFETTFNF